MVLLRRALFRLTWSMASRFFLVYFQFPECCQYYENDTEDECGRRKSYKTSCSRRSILLGQFSTAALIFHVCSPHVPSEDSSLIHRRTDSQLRA
jgi:hypothetical protein